MAVVLMRRMLSGDWGIINLYADLNARVNAGFVKPEKLLAQAAKDKAQWENTVPEYQYKLVTDFEMNTPHPTFYNTRKNRRHYNGQAAIDLAA